jgi:hypothetical protein
MLGKDHGDRGGRTGDLGGALPGVAGHTTAALGRAGQPPAPARCHERHRFKLDLAELVDAICSFLERAVRHEFTALALYQKDSGDLVVHAVANKSGDGQRYVGKRFTGSAADEVFSPERTLVFGEGDVADRFADTAARSSSTSAWSPRRTAISPGWSRSGASGTTFTIA